MRQFVRSDAIVRSDPRLSGANTSADTAKRGKACFLLFLIEQNFYFVQSCVPKKRLPRWSRDAVLRIIADERMVVKFEQNNCYCSVRGDKVVFGQAASTRPVAHRWLPFHAARAPTLARAVFSASNTEHRHLWNKISPAATETPTRMDRCFYAL